MRAFKRRKNHQKRTYIKKDLKQSSQLRRRWECGTKYNTGPSHVFKVCQVLVTLRPEDLDLEVSEAANFDGVLRFSKFWRHSKVLGLVYYCSPLESYQFDCHVLVLKIVPFVKSFVSLES